MKYCLPIDKISQTILFFNTFTNLLNKVNEKNHKYFLNIYFVIDNN
jgi:hypothetical protein